MLSRNPQTKAIIHGQKLDLKALNKHPDVSCIGGSKEVRDKGDADFFDDKRRR